MDLPIFFCDLSMGPKSAILARLSIIGMWSSRMGHFPPNLTTRMKATPSNQRRAIRRGDAGRYQTLEILSSFLVQITVLPEGHLECVYLTILD